MLNDSVLLMDMGKPEEALPVIALGVALRNKARAHGGAARLSMPAAANG